MLAESRPETVHTKQNGGSSSESDAATHHKSEPMSSNRWSDDQADRDGEGCWHASWNEWEKNEWSMFELDNGWQWEETWRKNEWHKNEWRGTEWYVDEWYMSDGYSKAPAAWMSTPLNNALAELEALAVDMTPDDEAIDDNPHTAYEKQLKAAVDQGGISLRSSLGQKIFQRQVPPVGYKACKTNEEKAAFRAEWAQREWEQVMRSRTFTQEHEDNEYADGQWMSFDKIVQEKGGRQER